MCVIPELKKMYIELCKELSQLISLLARVHNIMYLLYLYYELLLLVIICMNVPNSFQEMCMCMTNLYIS